MIYEISLFELQQMLTTAAELGARQAISSLNLDKKQISQAEAYKTYGRKRIDHWRKEDNLKPIKQGERIFYDKAKLEQLAIVNRLYYGNVGEYRTKAIRSRADSISKNPK